MSALGELTARALVRANPSYKNGSNFIYGQHSEDVMSLIESGKADAGIVQRVDAIGSGHMRIIDEMPAGRHTGPIRRSRSHGPVERPPFPPRSSFSIS